MGNYMCAGSNSQKVQDEWTGPPTKVIHPDGSVEVFKRPVTVSELMQQHPDHFVCHSSAMICALSAKSALPGERELEAGRLYYVIPSHKFQDQKARDVKDRKSTVSARDLTFEIKHSKTPGFAQVTLKGQDVSKLFFDKHGAVSTDVDSDPIISYSTPDLRSMYLTGTQPSLMRCNSWKPRLETINEVSAYSRRRIQKFMRGRSQRKSQVHNF